MGGRCRSWSGVSHATPDGHAVELYWETRRFAATPEIATAFKNQPQRYVPRGIAPRRLDHLNVLARDVSATRRFFHELLGLRLTEQIIFDDGTEMGAWLSATNKSYDVAITHDRSGATGRLHHLTYMMDSREDVLRAADILRDADVPIETGPHKHTIGQTFFLYCYEPGGNRFEIGAGGYSDPRSRLEASRLDAGRAHERAGVGPSDRQHVSHPRHAAGAHRREPRRTQKNPVEPRRTCFTRA